jgi:hypothetical protein
MTRRPDRRLWTLLLALQVSVGCTSWQQLATDEALRELGCPRAELQVQDLGLISLWPEAPRRLRLFEATGCGDSRVYLCPDTPERRCVSEPQALWGEATSRQVLDAVHARRHLSRARCPEADLRLIQLDSTRFRFESCDGTWLYDCEAGRCRPAEAPRKP